MGNFIWVSFDLRAYYMLGPKRPMSNGKYDAILIALVAAGLEAIAILFLAIFDRPSFPSPFQCREIGYEIHEEVLKVLHELHTAMKTHQTYQSEYRQAENRLQVRGGV